MNEPRLRFPPLRVPLPARLPVFSRGMRIGLFGGSFNPPHEGHRLVVQTALRRLGLNKIWCLITPGNPLKNNDNLPLYADRMAACHALMDDPRVVITGFEAEIGTRYTADTLSYLRRRCPGVHFVWIMGADSLAGFHHWKNWEEIAQTMPIAVIDRPGSTLKAAAAKAARVLSIYRVDELDARALVMKTTPAWVFLYGPRSTISSTQLRKRRKYIKSS